MLIYKAMNVFPSAIREVVLEEYAADVAGPMRIRKRSATQVRFDDPLPLEVELTRPRSDADALRRRIEESVRERLRVRVAVELLDREPSRSVSTRTPSPTSPRKAERLPRSLRSARWSNGPRPQRCRPEPDRDGPESRAPRADVHIPAACRRASSW